MNEKTIFYFLLGVALFGSGGFIYMKARGIRNNNPGNIRHGDDWRGMSETQTDKSFIQFDDVVFGIRALNRILKNYQRRGISTIEGVINRWAPPVENDTGAYVRAVAARLHVEPGQTINLQEYAVELTQAIIKHENGLQPYGISTIETGVNMGWA